MEQTSIQGDLSAYSLAELFAFIQQRKQSGCLHLTQNSVHKKIYFVDNTVAGTHHTLSAKNLTKELAWQGRLTWKKAWNYVQRDEFLSSSDIDFLSEEDTPIWQTCVMDLLREDCCDLIDWHSGTFAFELLPLEIDKRISLALTAEAFVELLEETSRLWNAARVVLPDWRLVPKPRELNTLDFNRITLTPAQWICLCQVNGTESIVQMLRRSGQGSFSFITALVELEKLGVLSFEAPKEVVPEPHPQPTEVSPSPPAHEPSSAKGTESDPDYSKPSRSLLGWFSRNKDLHDDTPESEDLDQHEKPLLPAPKSALSAAVAWVNTLISLTPSSRFGYIWQRSLEDWPLASLLEFDQRTISSRRLRKILRVWDDLDSLQIVLTHTLMALAQCKEGLLKGLSAQDAAKVTQQALEASGAERLPEDQQELIKTHGFMSEGE